MDLRARRPAVWTTTVVLTLAMGVVAPPQVALAAPVLDQQQTVIDENNGLIIGGESAQLDAQIFTAGVRGDLVRVDLPVQCVGAADLIIEIRDVTATGLPGSTIRSTTTVAGSTIPPFWWSGSSPALRAFTLPTKVPVVVGEKAAIVLRSTGTIAATNACLIFSGPVGDTYAGGATYFQNVQSPNWTCICVHANVAHDVPFRTWVEPVPQADLALTLSEGGDPVLASFTSFGYAASVTNNGPAGATGIVVTFTLSADLVVASAVGCTVSLPTVTCPMPNLANGATGQVGINVKMANGTSATSVTVDATVVSSATVDPVATNNAASETTTVKAVVDMELLSLSAAPSPANVGEEIVYTATVKNRASPYSYPATNVVAIMSAPFGPPGVSATFVSATTPIAGAPCGQDPPTGWYGCNFGTLASNATATITLKFTAPTLAAKLSSQMIVSAAEPELQGPDSKTAQVEVVGELFTGSGGSGTTDLENCGPTGCDGATAADPIETTVNLPSGATGTITIKEVPTTGTPPSGYSFLGQQVTISAPAGTPTSPIEIQFEIHPSLIPAPQTVNTIQIFRTSGGSTTSVQGCAMTATTTPQPVLPISPDPCIASRQTLANGNALIVVLTSTASVWSFGIHDPFDFGGFQQPLRAGTNMANAGRAVPLKFSLHGFQGMTILAGASPASREVSCATGAPLGELAPARLNGGGLHYDETTDIYSLIWGTSKEWSGTCRDLVLTLIDASVHTATFAFR